MSIELHTFGLGHEALSQLIGKWTVPDAKVLRVPPEPKWENAQGEVRVCGTMLLELARLRRERDESSGWDCIALGETRHHKKQMGFLGWARKRLRDGGKLILVGEYLRDVDLISPSTLPTEFSLLQLAQRLGFQLKETIDWTEAALRSVADAQAAESENGHRRFEGFVFELDESAGGPWSGLDLGDIDSFEPEEVAEIFEESFGEKFDADLWRWKYGAGKGTCIVGRAEPGGPVIAHYGGVAREIDYFGADQLAFQGCDVMVKPAVRRQYGRNSLYFHMTATLFEREIGFTADHVLGFGFPNKPVMRAAVRLGLYGKVDDFVELALEDFPDAAPELQIEALRLRDSQCAESHGKAVDQSQDSHRGQSRDTHRAELHAKSVDELWRAMRGDFGDGVIGKRHSEYLEYRYFQHPHAEQYFPLLLTRGGSAFAAAVLKRHEKQWLLMDAVAPLARMNEVVAAVRGWVDSRAETGPPKMWLTKAWVERLSWRGRVVKDLGIEIPFNAWSPGPDSTLPQGAWWLTAGDMDFM